ncbi:MAG: CvpA family protein [Clostridiaceae bacterium]|nr:CvpA family protein [Clostridiaceae bacterium]
MKTLKNIIFSAIITFLLAFILNYIWLPAWNIRSIGTWLFVIIILLIFAKTSSVLNTFWSINPFKNKKLPKTSMVTFGIITVLVILLAVAGLFSSRLVKSKEYASLLEQNIVDGDIEDYKATIDNVPLLDKNSSLLLANRKLGTLIDVVSQFKIDDSEQITVKGKPIRVSILEYDGFFKWINNKDSGCPGFIKVDMTTQDADLVRVEGGIKYSPSEYFRRDLKRYLRKNFPTLMFEQSTLELDENEHPYWIAPIVSYKIGLFGGRDIIGVVIVDAVTGVVQKYNVGEIPDWLDNVFSSSLIMNQYDDYGKLQNGFWNSIIGQRGVKVTTDGYNYIPQGNDNYIYTGVTSAGKDESNIGFIVANKRTKEVVYYPQSGAEEYSAMSSAEGMVQDLGYQSTFPLLLKIEGQPTYMVALKDAAGLVKMYAMINVEKYQIVAIGDTIKTSQNKYRELLKNSGVEVFESEKFLVKGKIEAIKEATKQGTTYYYIKLENNKKYFSLSIVDNEEIILLQVGDYVELNSEIDEGKTILPAILVK